MVRENKSGGLYSQRKLWGEMPQSIPGGGNTARGNERGRD